MHRELGNQPFLFTNSISELGRLLNVANVSGCKSAKDRTGNCERYNIEMALRMKFVRGELTKNRDAATNTAQILPPVDRRLTSEDSYNQEMLLLCSGQIENTINNLGKPGFKIPDYMLGFAKKLYPVTDAYLSSPKKKKKGSSA